MQSRYKTTLLADTEGPGAECVGTRLRLCFETDLSVRLDIIK